MPRARKTDTTATAEASRISATGSAPCIGRIPREAYNLLRMSKANLLQPPPLTGDEHYLELARVVLDIEADAVRALKERIGEAFLAAHRLMLQTKGRVVVTGMGKSGHIGNKIAATL